MSIAPDNITTYATNFTATGYTCYPVNLYLDPTGNKIPQFKTGEKGVGWKDGDYPTDQEAIAEHWQGYSGIAINTGRSGLVVVDIDTSKGKNGHAALRDAEIILPTTPMIIDTHSGGEHWYYRMGPIPVHNSQSELAAGVDIRAIGGVVFAPPTAVAGSGSYRLRNVPVSIGELPEFPDHLAEKLSSPSRTRRTYVGKALRRSLTPPERVFHKGRMEEALEAIESLQNGCRHTGLLKYGPIIFGVADLLQEDSEDFVELIETAYELSGGTDWSSEERTVRDAMRYAAENRWELDELDEREEIPETVPENLRGEFVKQRDDLRVRYEAQEFVKKERIDREAAKIVIAEPTNGTELLAQKPEQSLWLIEGLLHWERARGLAIGQWKAGKSTVMLNMIHALTTGQPFLGKFHVTKPIKVAYMDLELGASLAYQWLTDMPGLVHERIEYFDMVGLGRQLDLRSEYLRRVWAQKLMDLGVELLIIDPLSPIISAANMDENSAEVRGLLDHFDELSAMAGLHGVVVSHHAGHENKNRARGSSTVMDWLTTRFSITKNGESLDATREFHTDGRGTDIVSGPLILDVNTNLLTLGCDPNATDDEWLRARRNLRLTLSEVMEGMDVKSPKTARKRLLDSGWVSHSTGPRTPATWSYDGERGGAYVPGVDPWSE